jgi:hypothetical protein
MRAKRPRANGNRGENDPGWNDPGGGGEANRIRGETTRYLHSHRLTGLCWHPHVIRDVNRFWSSRRKLKSSRQIDVDGKLGALYSQGSGAPRSSGINGAKSCILGLSCYLISLLKLHFFVLFFSYFQQLFKIKDPFYYFWLYCGSDSGTSICWLQRCIKILFLQCN